MHATESPTTATSTPAKSPRKDASTRIKYDKDATGKFLTSTRKFQHPTNGARYVIRMDLHEHQWLVVNEVTEIIEASGRNLNVYAMKSEAKAALRLLGIVFPAEKRNR